MAQTVKNLSASAGDTREAGSISGPGRSPEKEMATRSSILAWRIPWTEEPGGLQSMGGRKVLDMTEQLIHTHTNTHTHTKCISLLSVNAKLKLCSEPSLKVLPQGLLFLMASEWRRVSGGRRRSAASSGRLVPGSTEVWSVSSARLEPCSAAPADCVPPASDGEARALQLPTHPRPLPVASVPPLLGGKWGLSQSGWQLPPTPRYPSLQAHFPFDSACWVGPVLGL